MSKDGALIGTQEWCDKCHTNRTVVDDHTEASLASSYMSYTTTEEYFRVLDLECGHSKEFPAGSTAYRDGGA